METISDEVMLENIIAAIDSTFEEIFIHHKPLDVFPLSVDDFRGPYKEYLKYENIIPQDIKKNVLLAIITHYKVNMYNYKFHKNINFMEEYPSLANAALSYLKWKKETIGNENENLDRKCIFSNFMSVEIGKIIKNAFKEYMTDFKYEKKGVFSGVKNYSKPWFNTNILILADRGTKRSWVDFYIGFSKPQLCFPIEDLLLINSIFSYNTTEEAEENVSKAIKILKIYIEVLSKCFKEVLEEQV